MRLDPFTSTTPSANCRAADALAVELSAFLCPSPLPSQVTCTLHRGVNLHLLSTYCFTDSLTPLCTQSSSEIRVDWITDRFPVKTRLMSDDMDSTCWSTYWTRCLRKALAAWPMQLILPSPFDETQTPDSLRIGLSENACFPMAVSDFR